jgi:CHAT domain-containing protein
LYDDVIRPVDAVLDHAREIVIVPDRRLEKVPFAALYDGTMRRHLIERFPVSIAANAGSLSRDEPRGAAPSLVTIALPSGDATTASLPEAQREVRDIAGLYSRAQSVSETGATLAALRKAVSDGDVVHVAGHTEQQTGGGEEALLFAGERVSWKSIVAMPAMRAVVIVLAACDTLRPPSSAATRAFSLGAAFSAAGARDVIGTLAPIGDHDARLLFDALHRRLASGARSTDALRDAQLEAITRDKTNGGRRAWRAVELMTRRLPAS